MPEWLRTALVIALAMWPVWAAFGFTYVARRLEAHQDRAWEDNRPRPGELGSR